MMSLVLPIFGTFIVNNTKCMLQELTNKIERARDNIRRSGGNDMFQSFLLEHYGKRTGFSKANISYLIKTIAALNVNESNYEVKVEDLTKKVLEFENTVFAYLNHDNSKADKFCGTTWYVYFFYESTSSRNSAGIGRAILNIDAQNKVSLQNIQVENAADYHGGMQLNNGVLFLNLYGARRENMLHIKVNSKDRPTEIIVGGYISYEGQSVRCGTIIMQDISYIPSAKVGYFNFHSKEFSSIPVPIIEFLAVKNKNLLKLPQNIYSIEQLKKFSRDHRKNPKLLFLDTSIPKLFISTPTNSILEETLNLNANTITKIITKLEQRLLEKNIQLNVRFPGSEQLYNKNIGEYKKRFIDNLKKLETTKYFVLILNNNKGFSKALLELGYSINRCKVIVVFYKDSLGSDRKESSLSQFAQSLSVLSSDSDHGSFYLERYTKDLSKDSNYITNRLFNIITNHQYDNFVE